VSTQTQSEADRLDRIEAKVDEMLSKLAAFEKLAGSFVTGPGITKLFTALRTGGRV
jgi:hypothetical protein